ncbi:MAG: hypothetical protein NT103_08025 [Campylobacterales bacterium]|nr:hypothetical protein [Campylobacterales bacterium]
MTKIKKTLIFLIVIQTAIALLLFISKAVFASFEVALLSGAVIIMGSLYAYRNMIRTRTLDVEIDDNKDIIDMMDDPYDLYEEERQNEVEDIKELIKEEKVKQKQNIIENTTKNSAAWVSVYRLLPYAFLVLGFLGLQNNHSLELFPYLTGLGVGIIAGYFLAKEWF